MDRTLRNQFALPLLALVLLTLPACNDGDSQQTGALTPVDPPVLLRVESPHEPLQPTPAFTPVVVPASMPQSEPILQPTGGTAPIDPEQDPQWWQSYLSGEGQRAPAGPELNAPMRETPAHAAPSRPAPQRMPAPSAPDRNASPAPATIQRLPAVPQPSPHDRTAAGSRPPLEVAMSAPPALPASPGDAFGSSRRSPVEDVELGMPTTVAPRQPASGAPSRSAQPVLPNYAQPEYELSRHRQLSAPQRESLPRVELTLEPPQQAASRPAPARTAPPVASVVESPAAEIAANSQSAGPRPEDPMWAVNQRADQLIARGNSLAARGAHYSARTDLVQALRLITQANDARLHTNVHSEALSAALKALRESDDFVPQGTSVEADLNLSQIISVHRTPVLKNAPTETLTSLAALQAYYTYAQDRFAEAAAGNPAASRALYSLARLHSLLAETLPAEGAVLGPKALALHQAALITDPTNYRAANELGVLLARYGQYNQARTVLLHGLSVETRPELWENLAIVYERQGDVQLAQRARHEAQIAAQQPAPRSATEANPIEWVAPESFRGPPEEADIAGMPAMPAPAPAAAPRSARESNSFTDWLPWQRSR